MPPAGVPCKHIIGVQLTLERETHNGGKQILQYEELKTLTGIPVTELPQKLDEQLPTDAYSAVPGRVDLTDIVQRPHKHSIPIGLFPAAGAGPMCEVALVLDALGLRQVACPRAMGVNPLAGHVGPVFARPCLVGVGSWSAS